MKAQKTDGNLPPCDQNSIWLSLAPISSGLSLFLGIGGPPRRAPVRVREARAPRRRSACEAAVERGFRGCLGVPGGVRPRRKSALSIPRITSCFGLRTGWSGR